jgi:hypothetical protein
MTCKCKSCVVEVGNVYGAAGTKRVHQLLGPGSKRAVFVAIGEQPLAVP